MRLWQQPAQQLPVRLRPVRGETVVSYAFRLATANELDRPTILLRALGEPCGALTFRLLDDDYDVELNRHSLRRLETFTGIPAERLRKSLPSLNHTGAIPADIPTIRPYRSWLLRNHCDTCVARTPGQPKIRVHSLLFPRICALHGRWIDTNAQNQPRQVDLTNAPEIITAHRRYGRLRAQVQDGEWVREQLWRATWVAIGWAQRSHRNNPKLHTRWSARGQALRIGGPASRNPLLVFPEAVVLAEAFCDLEWRRHIAMIDQDNGAEMARFFRHVTNRLGQPPTFLALLTKHLDADPLRGWVSGHRATYQKIRTEFWEQFRRSGLKTQPFPEIRHFK